MESQLEAENAVLLPLVNTQLGNFSRILNSYGPDSLSHFVLDRLLLANLPTSELQNACWGCAGEQLQASAVSSARHTNSSARASKQLLSVRDIFSQRKRL